MRVDYYVTIPTHGDSLAVHQNLVKDGLPMSQSRDRALMIAQYVVILYRLGVIHSNTPAAEKTLLLNALKRAVVHRNSLKDSAQNSVPPKD